MSIAGHGLGLRFNPEQNTLTRIQGTLKPKATGRQWAGQPTRAHARQETHRAPDRGIALGARRSITPKYNVLVVAARVLILCIAAPPARAQGERMTIDHVDISRYEEHGILRYYVDIVDQRSRPISLQDAAGLSFFANDDPIGPELIDGVELRAFKDVGEPIAVGILFTNYAGFIPKSGVEPSLFGHSRDGVVELLGALRQNKDKVGIWLYNDVRIDFIVPFTDDVDGAAARLRALSDAPEPNRDDGAVQGPNFYRNWNRAVHDMASVGDLPRRRVLIVVSDGVGAIRGRSAIAVIVQDIVSTAKGAGIQIHTFAPVLKTEALAAHMARAASDTAGIHKRSSSLSCF